ncbi:MAG: NTP transferase domain-containing protein [Chloroflexota bacterium]
MDALILAGGIPKPDDSLYQLTQGKPKALLEINGRSLIDYVLQVLLNAPSIEDILIIGLAEDDLPTLPQNVFALPNQGGLVQNGVAGLLWLKRHRGQDAHVAVVSVDIPMLTAKIVEQVIANCLQLDAKLYYHFVTRPVFEAQFPEAKRTFVKLQGLEVAGTDLVVAYTALAENNEALYEALVNGRKQAWKLARIVGLRFLLKFLFRRVSISDLEQLTTNAVQMPVRVILSPHAEIGMDIDKLAHYELVQQWMSEGI